MPQGFDPSIVIFAALAIFVIWKLRSVLGARVDIDRKPPSQTPAPGAGAPAARAPIRLPGAPGAGAAPNPMDAYARTDKARDGLRAIAGVDRAFDARRFLDGAGAAYRLIVEAFARGDRQALEGLLGMEVFRNFDAEMRRRADAGEQAEASIQGIDLMEVADAALVGRMAQITTKIEARMIHAVRDRNGAVISGDPALVVTTEELWTFARDLDSSDPNWRLVATEAVGR